ncbi:MAG: hypothetical protein ABWY54_05125 [Glaciihabitans sp.]
MATENQTPGDDRQMRDAVRGALHDADLPTNQIDAGDIIRRSKKRRLPRTVGTGAALCLAVVGIGIAGFTGLGGSQGAGTAMSDSAETADTSDTSDTSTGSSSSSTSPESSEHSESNTFGGPTGIDQAPVEKLNLCGGPLAEVAPSPSGLTIAVDLPDSPAGSESIQGTATLTNNGTETVVGYTAASPALTLSQDGTVIWHSNGPMIMLAVDVDLEPGESLSYPVTMTPVVCDVVDDTGETFREDLPAAPAGQYQVGAAITVRGEATADTVTGPLSDITLH